MRAYLQRTPNTRPERRSIWLITYLPSPAGTNTPTHVRVFAHKLKREELLKKGPIPPLDDLVLSRRELPAVGLPPSIPFPSLARPDMFGLAVESIVRDAFEKSYGRPGAPPYKQAVGRHGPDVLWRELAGLFRELAEETGERYWRELAEELLPEL